MALSLTSLDNEASLFRSRTCPHLVMKRPALISKGSLDRILQAAQQAWVEKDFQQHIGLLERASRLNPSNATIHLQMGRYHGLRYDYAAAVRCFEHAVRVSPRK